MHRALASLLGSIVLSLSPGCSHSTRSAVDQDAQSSSCSDVNDPSCQNADADAASQDTSCPGATVTDCPATVPSFTNEVLPIINARCTVCHTQNNDAGLWPLNDQQSLSDWQVSIIQALRACTQPPPTSSVHLQLSERKIVEAWLVCGAPAN